MQNSLYLCNFLKILALGLAAWELISTFYTALPGPALLAAGGVVWPGGVV